MASVRVPNFGCLQRILDAVDRLYATSVAPQMKYADVEKAKKHIEDRWACDQVVVVGDFAVVFDIGSMWYSSEPMVFEELVIRYAREYGNDVSDVVPVLDTIRKRHRCVAVITGDAQRGLMGPVYTANGFVPAGTQYFKDG